MLVRSSSFTATLDVGTHPWQYVVDPKGTMYGWVFGGYIDKTSVKEFSGVASPEAYNYLCEVFRNTLVDEKLAKIGEWSDEKPEQAIDMISRIIANKLNPQVVQFTDAGFGIPGDDLDNDWRPDAVIRFDGRKRKRDTQFDIIVLLQGTRYLPIHADWDLVGMGYSTVEKVDAIDLNGDKKWELICDSYMDHDGGFTYFKSFICPSSETGEYIKRGQIETGFYSHNHSGEGCGYAEDIGRSFNRDELKVVYEVKRTCRRGDDFRLEKVTLNVDLSKDGFSVKEVFLSTEPNRKIKK